MSSDDFSILGSPLPEPLKEPKEKKSSKESELFRKSASKELTEVQSKERSAIRLSSANPTVQKVQQVSFGTSSGLSRESSGASPQETSSIPLPTDTVRAFEKALKEAIRLGDEAKFVALALQAEDEAQQASLYLPFVVLLDDLKGRDKLFVETASAKVAEAKCMKQLVVAYHDMHKEPNHPEKLFHAVYNDAKANGLSMHTLLPKLVALIEEEEGLVRPFAKEYLTRLTEYYAPHKSTSSAASPTVIAEVEEKLLAAALACDSQQFDNCLIMARHAQLNQLTFLKTVLSGLKKETTLSPVQKEFFKLIDELSKASNQETASSIRALIAQKKIEEAVGQLQQHRHNKQALIQVIDSDIFDIAEHSLSSSHFIKALERALPDEAKLVSKIMAQKPPYPTKDFEFVWLRKALGDVFLPSQNQSSEKNLQNQMQQALARANYRVLDSLLNEAKAQDFDEKLLLHEALKELNDHPEAHFTRQASVLLQMAPNLSFAQVKTWEQECKEALRKPDLTKLDALNKNGADRGLKEMQLIELMLTLHRDIDPETKTLLQEILKHKALNQTASLLERAEQEKMGQRLKSAFGRQDLGEIQALISQARRDSMPVAALAIILAEIKGLDTLPATYAAAKEQHLKLDSYLFLERFFVSEIGRKSFENTLQAFLSRSINQKTFDQAISLAKDRGVSYLESIKRQSKALYEQEKAKLELSLQDRLLEAFNSPINACKALHVCVDLAKQNGINPRAVIEAVLQKSSPPLSLVLERVLARFDALLQIPYALHKLNPYELLRIASTAEGVLKDASTSKEATKIKGPELGLTRSLLADFKNKKIVIVLGKHGDLSVEGGQGKIRASIELSEKGALSVVQKTPKTEVSGSKRFDLQEVAFEVEFGGPEEMRMFVSYPHKEGVKEAMVLRRYMGDFSNVIMKGALSDLKEMFRAYDGVTRKLSEMHAKGVVHGDFKNANLLWAHLFVKLADYGFTKKIGRDQVVEHHPTPSYVSPEFIAGDIIPDDLKYHMAQDAFALGCALYECVMKTKELPWHNETTKWKESLHTPNPEIKTIIPKMLEGLPKDHPFTPLIKGLLDVNPDSRMTLAEFRVRYQEIGQQIATT